MRHPVLFLAALCSLYPMACSSGDPSGGRAGDPSDGDDAEYDPFANNRMPVDPSAFPQTDGGPINGDEDDEPGKCGSTSVEAEPIVVEEEVIVESEVTVVKPVALYIMFDKSLSMDQSGLWEPAVAAMNGFIDDEDSAGLRVGLQYFPNGGSCADGSGYDSPAVAVGELPGHAEALAGSLEQQNPNGYGTPIEGALRGVTEFCKARQAEPEHVEEEESCVAVLVTDGKPQYASGCNENHAALAEIAGDAHAAGVTTFAVGLMGADFTLLDQIAMQGGAPDCDPDSAAYACDVSSGAGKLRDALTSIRDTVVKTETHTETVTHVEEHRLPCEWELPAVPEGQTFDRNKVNIELTSEDEKRAFGRVASPDDCVENGWHFDDADSPSRILACPQTCDVIEALPDARIDILLGCATVTIAIE